MAGSHIIYLRQTFRLSLALTLLNSSYFRRLTVGTGISVEFCAKIRKMWFLSPAAHQEFMCRKSPGAGKVARSSSKK